MGILYVAIFAHFLCSQSTSVFTVDNILNKVKKVKISCVLFYSESPISWLNGQPLWFIMNSLCQYGDKLLLILNILEVIYQFRKCDKYVITCLVLYHALVSRPDLAISALVLRTRADIAKSGRDTGRDIEQDM